MGNKRGRAPRNKKSNNWTVIHKKAKKGASFNQELGEQDALIEPSLSENQTISLGENENTQECSNNSVKRRRMSNLEENASIFPDVSENYYAWLSEDNDGNGNENISLNENEYTSKGCFPINLNSIKDVWFCCEWVEVDQTSDYVMVIGISLSTSIFTGAHGYIFSYPIMVLKPSRSIEKPNFILAHVKISENSGGQCYGIGNIQTIMTQHVDPLSTVGCDEESGDGHNVHNDEEEDFYQDDSDDDNEDENVFHNYEDIGDPDGNYLSNDDDDEAREEVILEEKEFGRRLFEYAALFEQIKRIGRHSKNCSFEDMNLISEIKKGLNSVFKFQCKKCGMIRKLESCPKKQNSLSCNQEAVLGINSVGSGFYHLQEFLSQLNVPCMGGTLYDNISKEQQTDWYILAKNSAMEALQEEIDLAVAAGEVDSIGNALIAAICDGSWAKRSYGKKFNSLSGCAVLIGVRTKKVVFFGVRNKYCHTCKIAQSKCTPVQEHVCNTNYTGPSSGMEADIIVEGFRVCEGLGARFYKLIADGDSNTYKTLQDLRIYQNPDLFIEKLECVNHLCRNFRSKFFNLHTITKFNSNLRKHVKPSKGNDICKGVKVAAKHWRESNLGLSQKIKNLEQDIMNAPSHYFGVHTKCKTYFCNKTTSRAAVDNLNLLKSDGLYYEIQNLCQVYFASNAKSLLENFTNNAAEEFNNIVAKYLGGKRINYSLARSYTARVASAVVQYNTRGHAGTAFRKFKLGDDHQSSTAKLETNRKRKVKANAIALESKARERHPKEETTKSSYLHGDGTEDLDMQPEKFRRCRDIFLKKLKARQQDRKRIERQTLDKRFDSYWQVIRRDMLPSSHFYRIVNAIKRESYTNILEEIIYNRSEFGNNAQNKHQQLVERDALEEFEKLFPDEDLLECGLFIDKELSFLCASPLRLYGKNHILSIKCPVGEYNKKFEKVISKIKFFKNTAGGVVINEKSEWFIELKGEMRVTNRKFAFIMIWLGESNYKCIEVARKDDFFITKMKEKLTYFYTEVMLKELVDSRNGRKMNLRVYDNETASFV